MWIILGICSLISTIINVYFGIKKRLCTKCTTTFALIFMTLTILNQYIMVKKRVLLEDWSDILDVVPSMTTVLIIYTIIIVTINVVALWNFFNKIKCYHKKTGFPVFL